MRKIELNVNGNLYEIKVEPYWTLLHVLREVLELRGTKEGCNSGECGACTVLIDGEPNLSCMIPIMRTIGKKITTIEGLAKDGKLDPVQEAFVNYGAIQCGFCTPGIILAAKSLLDENPNPSTEEIKEAITGHTCRCTGYVKIIKAISEAGKKKRIE